MLIETIRLRRYIHDQINHINHHRKNDNIPEMTSLSKMLLTGTMVHLWSSRVSAMAASAVRLTTIIDGVATKWDSNMSPREGEGGDGGNMSGYIYNLYIYINEI